MLLLRPKVACDFLGPWWLFVWLFVLKNDWCEGDFRPKISLVLDTIWLDTDRGNELLQVGGSNFDL